jgi:hypothetical protein
MKRKTLLILIAILALQSCAIVRLPSYLRYGSCPTNDPYYFYKRNGAKIPREFKQSRHWR